MNRNEAETMNSMLPILLTALAQAESAPQTFDIAVIIVILVICTGVLTLFAKYKK